MADYNGKQVRRWLTVKQNIVSKEQGAERSGEGAGINSRKKSNTPLPPSNIQSQSSVFARVGTKRLHCVLFINWNTLYKVTNVVILNINTGILPSHTFNRLCPWIYLSSVLKYRVILYTRYWSITCLTWAEWDCVFLPWYNSDVGLNRSRDNALEDGYTASHSLLVSHSDCVGFPRDYRRSKKTINTSQVSFIGDQLRFWLLFLFWLGTRITWLSSRKTSNLLKVGVQLCNIIPEKQNIKQDNVYYTWVS